MQQGEQLACRQRSLDVTDTSDGLDIGGRADAGQFACAGFQRTGDGCAKTDFEQLIICASFVRVDSVIRIVRIDGVNRIDFKRHDHHEAHEA